MLDEWPSYLMLAVVVAALLWLARRLHAHPRGERPRSHASAGGSGEGGRPDHSINSGNDASDGGGSSGD